MPHRIDKAGLEAAMAAFLQAESNPNLVPCSHCSGKGYQHGYGEGRADPDWCTSCGGGCVELVDGEEDRPLREAISAYLSATSAGVTEEQVEALADFLCSEFDADFNPVVGAVWPEHADDDGYRGNRAYVRLQPSDVQAHARDNARRILTFLGQRSPASRVAPVGQKEAVPVAECETCVGTGTIESQNEGPPDFGFTRCPTCSPSPAPAVEPVGIKADARLYNADEPMADGEIEMTAAENVLAWLIIEKIGVPDDRNYSPNEAQAILSHRLDAATEMETALVTLSFADYRGADHSAPAPASVDAGEPAGVSPDWLWTRLMRWCKRRGFAPASYDDLFEIVGEARIRSALHPTPTPVSAPAGVVEELIREAIDLLKEKKHGNPARSPGHNARLMLEDALAALRSPAVEGK